MCWLVRLLINCGCVQIASAQGMGGQFIESRLCGYPDWNGSVWQRNVDLLVRITPTIYFSAFPPDGFEGVPGTWLRLWVEEREREG